MRPSRLLTILAALTLVASVSAEAQTIDQTLIDGLTWRQIGPANMSGRTTDIEGIPSPSKTFYVLAAAGGVWKTTNNGTTFRPIFDNHGVASMGDIAIAPSDTNILYLGTGEPNSRNSISPGGGVFKSTDGGTTWTFVGLKETEHVGRVIVHPTNPNVAWVAALGAAWRPNRERGLYKTIDGGATWVNKKYINDTTGFVDVDIHPRDPNILFAASYHRLRGPYFLQSGGRGSALWKSTDGGETWSEVTGGGFPETMKGRMEIAIAPSNPDIMYVMVEADTAANARPAAGSKPQERRSGLYRSADGGRTWERTAPDNVRPFYYSQVRVHPTNPDRVWFSSTPVKVSDEGGKNARNSTIGLHVDHHAMWIDPVDPERHIVGNDGGIGISFDNGGNYDFPNTFALGQFYNISYDMAVPYRVCGGLQDNGSWCGPSRRRQGAITNAMWSNVGGGDGFVTQQDPTNPDIMYSESQGGNMGRYVFSTGTRTGFQAPNYRAQYMRWEDSMMVVRGDTTRPATPAARRTLADLRARQLRDSTDASLVWNWNTPFFLSPHNSAVVYMGANRVMKSVKRGDDMYAISPDLTYADPVKLRISTVTTGGITIDATRAETFGTIVSLNESPIKAGLLYAGTDDGRLWLSRNDGGAWEELTARVRGVPAGTYASRIEPSSHDVNTFYVTYDNHRRGDFMPYVFATSDGGATFRSIADGLPRGGPDFAHVIREDPRNADLLFVGTDVGAYVSGDRGVTWQKFMTGLPNTPVHDLKIHPRDAELIAGTHGRSIWIVDIAPLQQMKNLAAGAAHLFAPRKGIQWGEAPIGGGSTGNQLYQVPSPQYGADIWYRLSQNAGPVRVHILNVVGDTLQSLTGMGMPGLHRVTWGYQARPAPRAALRGAALRDSIVGARRMVTALDSIERAGQIPKPALDLIRQNIASGVQGQQAIARAFGFAPGGGGGGGGFAQPGRWVDRPAEQAPTPARPAGGPGAPGGPGGAAGAAGRGPAMGLEQSDLFAIMQAIGVTGGGGGFGGGGFGGGGPVAEPGDYVVSMTIDGQTYRQTLRVERVSGGATTVFPAEVEEMWRWYDRWLRSQR